MAQQLTFDLPVRAAHGRDDFFISPANELALNIVDNWQDWPDGKLVLCGPVGSGKSHLTRVWAADTHAKIVRAVELDPEQAAILAAAAPHLAVEDVDRISGNTSAQQGLFHLHNLVLAAGGRLLLSGTPPPVDWDLELPDLKSRIMGAGLAQIAPPDDALLAAVLVKLFADRQIHVSLELITYLSRRTERSLAAAARLVAQLDQLALTENRPITRVLAARLLGTSSEVSP